MSLPPHNPISSFADPSLPCVWMMSFFNGPLLLRYTYLVLNMGCIYLVYLYPVSLYFIPLPPLIHSMSAIYPSVVSSLMTSVLVSFTRFSSRQNLMVSTSSLPSYTLYLSWSLRRYIFTHAVFELVVKAIYFHTHSI